MSEVLPWLLWHGLSPIPNRMQLAYPCAIVPTSSQTRSRVLMSSIQFIRRLHKTTQDVLDIELRGSSQSSEDGFPHPRTSLHLQKLSLILETVILPRPRHATTYGMQVLDMGCLITYFESSMFSLAEYQSIRLDSKVRLPHAGLETSSAGGDCVLSSGNRDEGLRSASSSAPCFAGRTSKVTSPLIRNLEDADVVGWMIPLL